MTAPSASSSTRDRLEALLEAIGRRLPRRAASMLQRLMDRDLLLTASSLAFYGVVSALPLLMLTFAAVEAIGGEDTLRSFADRASSSGTEAAGAFLEPLIANGGSLTFATALFTLWPATAYGGGLGRALSHQTGEKDPIAGVRGRLLGVGLVLVLPTFILAGLPLMFVLTTLPGDGVVGLVLGWLAALVVGGLLGTVMTTLIYQAFTPESLQWRHAASGAALSAVTTAVFSLLFVIYLGIADTEERFGGGGTAVVVLIGVWLFVANILLLAGYQAVLELDDQGPGEDD